MDGALLIVGIVVVCWVVVVIVVVALARMAGRGDRQLPRAPGPPMTPRRRRLYLRKSSRTAGPKNRR